MKSTRFLLKTTLSFSSIYCINALSPAFTSSSPRTGFATFPSTGSKSNKVFSTSSQLTSHGHCGDPVTSSWCHNFHSIRQKRLSPLRYRPHDETDTDTTLIKLGTRAPPGYNVKEVISTQQQPFRGRRPPPNGINKQLIQACLQNQFLVLTVATAFWAAALVFTNGFSFFSNVGNILNWQGGAPANLGSTPTTFDVVTGILGALPPIVLGALIEKSDNRAFANTNFSTIIMVMTLFGRRKAPPEEFLPQKVRDQYKGMELRSFYPTTPLGLVLRQSFLLALVTGICEESVFRAEIPSLISHFSGGNIALALLGQSLVFGLGHVSPGTSIAENSIVMGLQATNGLWFGMLYLLSGGHLVPCIIAHALYDFQVFFLTWLTSNGQIEYAESMSLEPLPAETEVEASKVVSLIDQRGVVTPKILNSCKKLFFTFDFDKNKTLSLSEVRKGISYLWLERGAEVPPPQKYVDSLFADAVQQKQADKKDADNGSESSMRLRYPDFLRLYLTLQAQVQASTQRG